MTPVKKTNVSSSNKNSKYKRCDDIMIVMTLKKSEIDLI